MPWVQVDLLGQGTGEGEKVMNDQPFCIEKRYDMIDAQEMMKEPGVDDAITKVLVKMKMNAALGHSALAEMLSMASGMASRFAGLYAVEDPNASEVVIDSLSTIAAICVLCMVKVGQE